MLERNPASDPDNMSVPECLVLLPQSYAGRGPAETCVRLLSALPDCGINTTLFVLRARRSVNANIKVVVGAGPLLRHLPFRYMRAAAMHKLYRKFAHAINRAAPGTIAWFWPDSPIDLVRLAKQRGLITVREMINSPVAHAKPILDQAYRDIGLAPGHGITEPAVRLENQELQLYDYLFASNPEVEKALYAQGLPHDRVLSTSFGWDAARFSAPCAAPSGDAEGRPFRICFVGLMNVRKGIPVLIEAWKKAGVAGELLLAGSVEPALQSIVDDAIATGNVRHVGHVDDVADLYRKCDAFVFPTLEEGGPQVTYEAASCGLPVITTPMGAARLVEDGTTGIIVQAGNVDALAAALGRIEVDKELRIACSSGALEASKKFEYRIVGRERADLLRMITSEARPVS